MDWILIILLIILIGSVIFFFGMYNTLVSLRKQVDNAWAQIDVQLKRRYDLIPNLVETVKGYMQHERETLEKVVSARNLAQGALGVSAKAAAEAQLTTALNGFFAVAEQYPDLKANTNMIQLQEELRSTENKVSFARQYYNDIVTNYNTRLETVPSNIIANMGGFKPRELFELTDPVQRDVVKVKF